MDKRRTCKYGRNEDTGKCFKKGEEDKLAKGDNKLDKVVKPNRRTCKYGRNEDTGRCFKKGEESKLLTTTRKDNKLDKVVKPNRRTCKYGRNEDTGRCFKKGEKESEKPKEKTEKKESENKTEKPHFSSANRAIQAAKKIANFMHKYEPKRKALFLKSICPDSGVCISFGAEIPKINSFFSNFTDFKYAVSMRSIGKSSVNGFVQEILYSREGYDSYAVLKSSSMTYDNADNLMYEYEVGQFINKMNRVFPCFLETYGMFKYDPNLWKRATTMSTYDLKTGLTLLPQIDYSIGCKDHRLISILIQNIKKAMTLGQLFDTKMTETTKEKTDFINNELVAILYQIYMPLSSLKNDFTHYDLHRDNVLVYKPLDDSLSYMTYNYHLRSGETVTFKSRYIAKIIDYGRGYYYDTDAHNSLSTYDKICKIANCKPHCGYEKGLSNLGAPGINFISSRVNNESHDLRLINIIWIMLRSQKEVSAELSKMMSKIFYMKKFGTRNFPESGLPDNIHNVADMHSELKDYIMSPAFSQKMDGMKNIGEFHIYEDRRPMTFTEAA